MVFEPGLTFRETGSQLTICRNSAVLHFDFVIKIDFIAGLTAKSPVVTRCFEDRNFYIGWRDIDIRLKPLKKQMNELLFSFDASSFDIEISMMVYCSLRPSG